MYLFVPHPPPPNPHQHPEGLPAIWDCVPWNNQKEGKLQEDSPNELMIIKQRKLHINWILYFCCCSKQPVHVL